MSFTTHPNVSMRWIRRTISALRSPKRGVGSTWRGPANREAAGPTLVPRVSLSRSLMASSRRLTRSSATNGATFGMRALTRWGEKNFMLVRDSRI